MVACFFMTESHAQNKGNSLNLASQLTMSKTIRRTIDPKVLKGHPPLNKPPRAIMEPRMGGRKPRNTRKARKARKARKGNSEPRMDTNGHEWVGGNHEWTRKDTKGRVSPLLFKGILHITNWKSKSYIFGTFEGLRKTGNSYFSDKTLIFDSNLDKTLTFTPLPA